MAYSDSLPGVSQVEREPLPLTVRQRTQGNEGEPGDGQVRVGAGLAGRQRKTSKLGDVGGWAREGGTNG